MHYSTYMKYEEEPSSETKGEILVVAKVRRGANEKLLLLGVSLFKRGRNVNILKLDGSDVCITS